MARSSNRQGSDRNPRHISESTTTRLSIYLRCLTLLERSGVGTISSKELAKQFEGPCAVATHDSDPVALAKTLADFAKSNPELALVAGLVDARDLLEQADVKRLSALPGLPGLRAQLLALIQTPATTLVRLLGTPGTQLARVVDARREKQASEGEG